MVLKAPLPPWRGEVKSKSKRKSGSEEEGKKYIVEHI
jgi:hypothetical protein